MKKLLKVLLAVAMTLSITACGGSEPKPQDTLKGFLEDYKAQKNDDLGLYFTNGIPGENETNSVQNETNEEYYKEMVKLMTDIDYIIGEETIDGENAVVKLDITSYNLGEKFSEGITNALTLSFGLAFSGKNEEEIQKEVNEAMFAPLKKAEKNLKNSIEVTLIKSNDKWLIDSSKNNDLMNSVTGGLLNIVSSLANNGE